MGKPCIPLLVPEMKTASRFLRKSILVSRLSLVASAFVLFAVTLSPPASSAPQEGTSTTKGIGKESDALPFNPAVLSISFTEAPASLGNSSADVSEQQKASSFLDIVLVYADGAPIGKRVTLKREQLKGLLRAFYSQLARQGDLRVGDATSPSRLLYDILIRPISVDLRLHKITTLLISADRGLQAVPYAALHDGYDFFGQQYSFSLTPSVALTSFLASPPSRASVGLLAGASHYQDLAPLPLVPQELSGIASLEKADVFLNESFTPQVILDNAASNRYSRVHIATHADFVAGLGGTLYTGAGSIPIREFARLRQRRKDSPLDLFALSTCRSVVGDSTTELGFSGLALQAGARSAMGSLWYVDDVVTSAFYLQFYRYLDSGYPKAEALKATRIAVDKGILRLNGDQVIGDGGVVLLSRLNSAQKRRISGQIRHPYFWAGITLLGAPW